MRLHVVSTKKLLTLGAKYGLKLDYKKGYSSVWQLLIISWVTPVGIFVEIPRGNITKLMQQTSVRLFPHPIPIDFQAQKKFLILIYWQAKHVSKFLLSFEQRSDRSGTLYRYYTLQKCPKMTDCNFTGMLDVQQGCQLGWKKARHSLLFLTLLKGISEQRQASKYSKKNFMDIFQNGFLIYQSYQSPNYQACTILPWSSG